MAHPTARMHGALKARLPACLIAVAAGTGCAQLQPDPGHQREEAEQVSRVDRHSSFPAIRRMYFEQVNLIEMIDPHGRAERMYGDAWRSAKREDSEQSWGIRYDLVLSWFRENTDTDAAAKALARNGIQDKMLAVTTSRCNVFKTFLRRQQSDVNFQLGTATTAAGVLGAVLPGVRASRNLAGAAGFLSGTQAEFNSAYYSNLAAQVISQGVDLRQARLRKDLLVSRQGKSIDEYSLEAAINDALLIDGTCSTVTGLTEAAESIREVATPGLNRAASIIAAVKAAGEIAQAEKVSELSENGKLQRLLKQASPDLSPLVAVNLAQQPATAPALLKTLAEASRAKASIDEHIDGTAQSLLAGFQAAQARLAAADKAEPEVGKELVAQYKTAIGNVLPTAALQRCTAALDKPAKDFGSADAAARLEATDATVRAANAAALAAARVTAQAASDRVGLLVAFGKGAADSTAKAWRTKFAEPKLKLQGLKDLAPAAAPAALTDLCKPAS